MLEPVESNPYLTRFYEAPQRWAFSMQMHLLNWRYAIQSAAVWEAMLGHGAILDRGLPGDRAFARLHVAMGNIDPLEWSTYEQAFEIMAATLRPPSIVLFLDVSPEKAMERIRLRGRDAERDLPIEYLHALRREYMSLLDEIESGKHAWSQGMRVQRVPWDASEIDISEIVTDLGLPIADTTET